MGAIVIEIKMKRESTVLHDWCDLPIEVSYSLSNPQVIKRKVNAYIAVFEDAIDSVHSCRWNYKGSLQGHYISR